MIVKRYQSWRFIHPDLEAHEEFAGLSISPTGGIELVAESDSVRQAILLLLSTIPGERVMRPDYGCDLYRLIFSPNDDTTAGLAIHYVGQAIKRWEPRVEIESLDAEPNTEDAARLDILLVYHLRATLRTETFMFSVNLAGEET
ncbi:MAG TPA: GPW/gp25 family protein [Pyrinomonadaceae bacterium]|nr:GPW/gp25 family protein [Pyrinomonadaceae bacterium]